MILTQAPASSTFLDFWTMVWEQQVELIVCLNSDAEVSIITAIIIIIFTLHAKIRSAIKSGMQST